MIESIFVCIAIWVGLIVWFVKKPTSVAVPIVQLNDNTPIVDIEPSRYGGFQDPSMESV